MLIKKTLLEINFVDRYQSLCKKFNDFENSKDASTLKEQKKVFNNFEYDVTYFRNGSFYQIKQEKGPLTFQLHLALKRGVVEPFIFVFCNEQAIDPSGRLDFLPGKAGIPFNRDLYNLFFYSTHEQLKESLIELFNIYEDFKQVFLKHYTSNQIKQ